MMPFSPESLPLKSIEWSELIDLMGKANRYVARYDGLLQSIINPNVLLSPLRTKEAVLSSKIEGTQATLEEVMEYEAEPELEGSKKGDIYEIMNYRVAMISGKEKMKERPLSLNVIRQIHSILMEGVRGANKSPGDFRKIQNWIGAVGSTMEQARFVPPDVPAMKDALHNWEKYLHEEEKDVLVQLAIVHAQFEIIHPFLDGNGRIGRILIPLFLYHKEIIHEPVFYMSDHLESNRQEYYDALLEITTNGNWVHWIRFFLNGVIEQAEKNIDKTRSIIKLYERMKEKIVIETHSQYAIQCLDFIFTRPIFTSSNFKEHAGIPRASTARLLKSLENCEIIKCTRRGSGSRASRYVFRELLDIINT